MRKASKSHSTSSRKPVRTVKKKSAPPTATDLDRPGGKLGLIVDRLSTKSGATADELVKATGWQRPGARAGKLSTRTRFANSPCPTANTPQQGLQKQKSVLGALSRLKARGFEFQLDANADRKAYRLSTVKG